jgi:FMN-dependent oxidoreductase (nitrilotriacetate monooxygenase family)
MTKKIVLGVFEMMNPSNGMPTWRHPHGRADRYDSIDYWIEMARLLEANNVDFLFFADTYGYATIDGRMPRQVAEHGIQFPGFDPMLIIATLARETERLGFVITSGTTVERPYATARRFGSLDHYTRGRIGWNIVTGSSQATVDGLFGITDSGSHDSRYDSADEFVDLCLAFWEGSWEDDALVNDADAGVFIDPDKLHRIEITGTHHSATGVYAIPPSAQRTPVLFQAGTSDRGRAFAARNAEAVFIQGQTIAKAAEHVADIRAQAQKHGRDANDIKVISGITVTVAPTHDEAVALRKELEDQYALDDAAVIFLGFTGVDLLGLDPDMLLTDIQSEQGQTLINRFVRPGAPAPRVRDVLDEFRVKAGRGFQITGSPEEVADEIEAIIDGSDLDGVMLEPTFGDAESARAFLELVAPILRERGRLDPNPASATLRESITGETSGRLLARHPGARFRPATGS